MRPGRISSEAGDRRSSHLPSELAAAACPRALRRPERDHGESGVRCAEPSALARPLWAAEGGRAEGASRRGTRKFPGSTRGPVPSLSLLSFPQMWTRWLALALVAVAWVHAEVGEPLRRSKLRRRSHWGLRVARAVRASRGCSPRVGQGVSICRVRGALGAEMLLTKLKPKNQEK